MPDAICQSAIADLPEFAPHAGARPTWDGIDGLRILEVAPSSPVEGQPLVRFSTTHQRGRHRVGLAFRGLAAGQVYRTIAWLKIDLDARVMLDVRDGDPSSLRTASFDARRTSSVRPTANGGGAETTEPRDEWLCASADILCKDGMIVAYIALADRTNAEEFGTAGSMEFAFGGVEVVPIQVGSGLEATACRTRHHPTLPAFFVHIGLPKTATTSVQAFFGHNRGALLEQGILYPESGAIHDSHSLLHRPLGAVIEPGSVPWLASMVGYFREADVLSRLRGEVATANAAKVVVSSEDLTFMQQPALLKRVLEPYPVRILITLRRQDSFLDSFYNQVVKSRLYAKSFEQFLLNEASDPEKPEAYCPDLSMCDYHVLLDRWVAIFGRENILISVYEDFTTPSGVLEDMAAKIGFDIAPLAQEVPAENVRMSPDLVALKRRVNARLSGDKARIVAERFFSAAPRARGRSAPAAGDLARRRAIMDRFKASNALVARDYFAGRSQLFPPPSEHDAALSDAGETDLQGATIEPAVGLLAALIQQWPSGLR